MTSSRRFFSGSESRAIGRAISPGTAQPGVPISDRGTAVAHPRSNQAIVGVLFERMRNPACGSSNAKNRGSEPAREAHHPHRDRQVEVEIRTQSRALPNRFFNLERGLQKSAA